jgi:hypothetical protein
MTRVPVLDPFKKGNGNGSAHDPINGSFQYFEQKGIKIRGGGDLPLINCAFRITAGRQVIPPPWTVAAAPWGEGPSWLMFNAGPDGWEPWQLNGYVHQGAAPTNFLPGLNGANFWIAAYVFYDATNGTVSMGDIYRSQALSSFR